MNINKLFSPLIGLVSLLAIGIIYWSFYSPNERLAVYLSVVSLVAVSFIALFIMSVFANRKKLSDKTQMIVAGGFIGFNVLMVSFSFFQFTFVIMPYDYYDADPFPIGYEYTDLKDEVRIEYFARDYYGTDEIYRESYDKNEIKAFLKLFKPIETRNDYEAQGSPDIFMDWENDIHVMIRNMDEDNPDSGYYVMSMDIVDTSEYALKSASDDEVVFYEVPDELKEFVEEHLLLHE